MMKHKSKLGYLVFAVLAMALGMGGVANAANLTFGNTYTIDLSDPDVNLQIAGNSEADSLIVGTGSIQVAVGSGGTFTITSADRKFEVTGATSADVTNTCVGGEGKVVITGGSLGETITIAPTANTCPDDTGGGDGGGGGGGGGGSGSSATTGTTPAPSKPISQMTIPELQAELARLTALLAQLQAQAPAGPAAPAEAAVCSVAFNTDLAYGMVSNEVKRMQEFMISKGHLAAGYNTGNYYGLTANAVGAYQASKSISPVPNSFGPLTRAAANADCGL